MRVRRAFTIGRNHFYPQPNVDSSVVVLEPDPAPGIANPARFDEVVKAAFAYRRKTLVNSASRAMNVTREQLLAALVDLHIDPETRAEQLDLPTFARLTAQLDR
jgi:16S rRNA (adenine1518-N6/adenine1519-N6)-dimethyltransferase